MPTTSKTYQLLKKLISLSGRSQRQIAKETLIPYSTINDIVRGTKNKKLSNYFKLLAYFGVDLDMELENRIQSLSGHRTPIQRNRKAEDLYTLIENLDHLHRKELLTTAINLNKLKRKSKLTDVIDRVEHRLTHGE